MWVNDTNYIKRLKNRKEDALEFIVDKYLPLIKGITYKVLSSIEKQDLIEECINDIFLSIWNNADKFKGEEKDFKKWICVIAKFKAIDYYRKSSKSIEVAVDNIVEEKIGSAEDEAIVNEDREELVKLIDSLEDMDREIFIMKFFLDIKSEDIGKKLGITRAAVDNRIYRGKKKLREHKEKMRMEAL